MKKLIFMGTPQFAVPILEALIQDERYEIAAVVTQPDRKVGRKRVLTASPVKTIAIAHHIQVLQPEVLRESEALHTIIDLHPDVIITAAYGQFLPQSLLDAAPYGVINVHASLLPKYRGGAPVHAAIINGETETGVTLMKTVKKMDAGDILAVRKVPITSTDDVGTMFDTLSMVGRDLLIDKLPNYLDGRCTLTPQDEAAATVSPNLTKDDERIDWTKTATAIDCQVRGMRPWPVAHTLYKDTRWKLWDVMPITDLSTSATPGTIIKKDKQDLYIACGEGTVLAIRTLQPAGKGKQDIAAFLNGAGQHLQLGDRIGE